MSPGDDRPEVLAIPEPVAHLDVEERVVGGTAELEGLREPRDDNARLWTLARGHARSGDRLAIDADLGSGSVFDEAIAGFTAAYADQNQRDFERALTSLRS